MKEEIQISKDSFIILEKSYQRQINSKIVLPLTQGLFI